MLAWLSACKYEPSNPPQSWPQPHRAPGFSLLGLTIDAGPDTIAGEMISWSFVSDNLACHEVSISDYESTATFYNPSSYVVPAGDAQLNGVSLPPRGNWYQSYNSPSFGMAHHWHIASNLSGSVPAIDDSVPSPRLIHVTYPRHATDTISRTRGFNCTYENPGTDSITVRIYYDSVVTRMFDKSIHHPTSAPVQTTAENTGSYFVDPSVLTSFPNSGVIQVWVIAYRSKKLVVSGRSYMIASVSSARTYCFIKS